MTQDTLPQRFWSKVDKRGPDECWLWTGSVHPTGYGRLHDNGKSHFVFYAHRYAYELLVGPIPEGLTIDHLCRVRHCVNPAHLEAVTHRENNLRGESPAAKAARRTHCINGHPFDRVSKEGWRRCGVCARAFARLYAERRMELKH